MLPMKNQETSGGSSTWWVFVEEQLEKRGWSGADFERASGVHRSRLVNWKNGSIPGVELARATAEGFKVSVTTAFVAAGFLTAEELAERAELPDLAVFSDRALIRELERRLAGSRRAAPVPPTREEIAADPDRYEVIGLDQIQAR